MTNMPPSYDNTKLAAPDEPEGGWEWAQTLSTELNRLLSEADSSLIAEHYLDEESGEWGVDIRKSGWVQQNWWQQEGNVSRLCKWLVESQEFEAKDLLGVIEKPWNWKAEFEAMRKAVA